MTEWTIARARDTYSIRHWSEGYYDIGEQGQVLACPKRSHGGVIDLYQLAGELQASGIPLPTLLRFTDILHDRVNDLCQAFARAMENNGSSAEYHAVYPIKVNQQRHVIEEVLTTELGDRRAHVGLEAGSKPELMIVMAEAAHHKAMVICNGYKDREYIRLALIGRRLGLRIFIVIEKLSELELVIEESRALGVAPLLGMRARLASIGKGNWQNTGGEKSKFGLSATQMLAFLARLREADMLDCLQLLHVHLGSQIANLHDIETGLEEAMRCYTDLYRLGAPLANIDVGGGLGVDYEGTRSRSYCSINYSLQEYADTVVTGVMTMCREHQLPHPDIITESGRAMTAHHAVLLTNVIDVERQPEQVPEPALDGEPETVRQLRACLDDADQRSFAERYHAAAYNLDQARQQFSQGQLSLEQRSLAEQIYFAVCRRLQPRFAASSRTHHQLLDTINDQLADKYFCNFSLFQSLPDVWAIDQVFPIMPLHRLEQEPQRRGVITDITCDSDGRIDIYVDNDGLEASLPLHEWRPGQAYIIGMFLVGAYQEILGDCHNLFGDTHSVNVELLPDGSHRIYARHHGDNVGSVLGTVDFNVNNLKSIYRELVTASDIDGDSRDQYLGELEAGLEGYTYLEE